MIGVVSVDVGDRLVPLFEFGFIAFFYCFFPLSHDVVEFFYGRGPGFFGEPGEGGVVVAVEVGGFSSIEFIQ